VSWSYTLFFQDSQIGEVSSTFPPLFIIMVDYTDEYMSKLFDNVDIEFLEWLRTKIGDRIDENNNNN